MAEIGNLERINFLAINEKFVITDTLYISSKTGANNQLFMEFSKSDWDVTTEAGKVAEEIVNHLTAAELIKNKPVKSGHAQFLIDEAERLIKKLRKNPLFGLGSTSKPITVAMGRRLFKTRGMNEELDWYRSLKVNDDGNSLGNNNTTDYGGNV